MPDFRLFGASIRDYIKRDTKVKAPSINKVESFVPKKDVDEDVYLVGAGAGAYGLYYDIYGTGGALNDREMIKKYRYAAEYPECDSAINEIANEAIITDSIFPPVSINLEKLNYEESVKEKIRDEFNNIIKLLDFNNLGTEIFRRWYIDGRLYYHIIPSDSEGKGKGIKELRYVDPLYMRKVKEVQTLADKETGARVDEVVREYFVFDNSLSYSGTITNVTIDPNSIISVTSGLMNTTRDRIVSHMHKVVKPVNMLQMMEDSLVIYRLARAPERRIFYIDTGNLPPAKAEEYVRNIMSKYKNKIVYDASTGEVRDDRRHMSMIEDFWLPRREGGKGTEIGTLNGGQNLGEIDDIVYFQNKLYNSLNVPLSRFKQESQFTIGKAAEINREEVKFQKFIASLRTRFSSLFLDALRMQLLLKSVITVEDWEDIRSDISIVYRENNNYAELSENELLRERLDMMKEMSELVGVYYSKEWIRKNILRQTEEEIGIMDKQIAEEEAAKTEKTETDDSDINVDQNTDLDK